LDIDELPADDLVDYVHQLDIEQNERLQEEEHEIIRLWEARNTVLSQLEAEASNHDRNSLSEVDNESIHSQQTDCPKVERRFLVVVFFFDCEK